MTGWNLPPGVSGTEPELVGNDDASDWRPHGFTKRVHAIELVVYQLKDGCRWEARGELVEAAGYDTNIDGAKARADDAADAIDRLESIVSNGEVWGNRADKHGTRGGYVRGRSPEGGGT